MDHHNARIRREAAPCFAHCLRVAVDREQAPVRRESREYSRRVTAATECRIDIQTLRRLVLAGFIEAERNERFFDKHRCVLSQSFCPRMVVIRP
jgi:hypothetical protein